MNRIMLMILVIFVYLWSDEIEISQVKQKKMGKVLEVNAKIVQLSNQKQQIVSRLGGHIEEYYVKSGDRVKKGQKIAKIKSLELSNMSAKYFSLQKRIKVARQRVSNAKQLYKKGLGSLKELSSEELALSNIESELNSLKSQLKSLDIELKNTTDSYIIKAHADGKIERLLVNLHANLDAKRPIVSLVGDNGYYAEAYLPVDIAMESRGDVEAILIFKDKKYVCKYISLLPYVDETSGQAKMLFWIESGDDLLLLNSFSKMQIQIGQKREFKVIKSSALSMFDGEWVVFIPKSPKEHQDEIHDEDKKEDKHSHHSQHKDEEIPFSMKVVKIIERYGDEVAVKGLQDGEKYVSGGVYFVKSMLLKSKLSGHGH